jgi:uncharacterized RDD family membrane protein YckC
LQGLDTNIVARVFKRLTDTDLSQRRVRSPARISQLVAASGADRGTVEAIVARFEGDGRSFLFRSADGKPEDMRIDISHESLIRQWRRLRVWVDVERQSRDQYLKLVASARAWEDGKGALLWPPGLEPFLDWRDENVPTPAWADRYSTNHDDYEKAILYLDESVHQRCRYLAEAETQQSWNKKYKKVIVILEVLVGAALAEKFDLYEHARGVLPMLKAFLRMLSGDISQFGQIDWSFVFYWIAISLYLGSCLWINRRISNFHHRISFRKRLRRFEELGGRNPVSEKTEFFPKEPLRNPIYASTFRRYAGYLIDRVLSLSMSFTLLILLVYIDITYGTGDNLALTFLAVWPCSWLYEALQISSKHQATVGMRVMGIYRTDLYGERLSFGQASKWWFYRLVSYVAYGIGFAIQPFTPRRQTLHDLLARTIVLQRPAAEGEAATEPGKPAHVLIRVLQVFAYALVTYLIVVFVVWMAESYLQTTSWGGG